MQSLPTGVVAFLFTDVEGSTRRWERYGDAMRDALRRHDEILRSEIETHGGAVFKTIGDAFCAAFAHAGAALAAAVGAQRRLGREDFGATDGLGVRMAIHAGETDERDGDYFGSAVNRAARLLSAGHGGQILLSRTAADLALGALPEGITLRHLGSLPLRDIADPENVYQPVGAELRADFKDLRALETPPNNLPRQNTTFVGRRDDLAKVEALLETGSLLTLVGAGGIGKTRLALEVAAARLNDERDGAWFVDLASIADASLISDTLLATLGAKRAADADPLDSLLDYLADRELLLVLDNSEHLVAEVAAVVAVIVARCAHVTALATSREPLDIAGEQIYRLASLDAASATQLFGDRARSADPRFRLDEKKAIVAEICERLDGIALAIELAAARVRTMTVESLAENLELRMLSGGRDRRPRQQTMRALIDWSYDLLSEGERRVLRRCAVFVRGFTLTSAVAVCAQGATKGEVLDALGSLVDKSLVVAETQDGRYRLLEPIREYAREKLEGAAETAAALRAHAGAIAALARAGYEEWENGPRADWLARLERDLANARIAIHWALEAGNDPPLGARIVADATPTFLRLSLLEEGIAHCESALAIVPPPEPETEARLRYGLSMLYSNVGANARVLEQAVAAVARYRDAGDPRGLARALSQVASRQTNEIEGRAAAEEALRLARGSGDRRLLADTLRRCATAFSADGTDAVRARYDESVGIFRGLGRDDETARALEWWGQWEADVGNFDAAAQRFLDAAELDAGHDSMMYRATDIAGCYLAIGDYARAEGFAREGLALAARARHPVVVPMAISYLAIVASASDPVRAARLAGYAEERLRAAEFVRAEFDRAMAERLLGALEERVGASELARLLDEGASWPQEQAVARALS